MPPKPRFTKETILAKGKLIASKEGINSLNARDLAKSLNSSTQPIFSYYQNMDVLKKELLTLESDSFLSKYLSLIEKKDLRTAFLWICSFAQSCPNEFQDIFSLELNGDKIKKSLDDSLPKIALWVSKKEKLSYELANIFYFQTWIFAFGLASLLANGQFLGNEKVLEGLLQNEMTMVLTNLKNEKKR